MQKQQLVLKQDDVLLLQIASASDNRFEEYVMVKNIWINEATNNKFR